MLYRELGESRGLAASLNDLGWSWFWQNDFVTARRYFQESIDLAREVHVASVLAFALHSYSTVCTAQSNFEEAFPRAEESVKLCQELGDIHGLIAALVALSRIVLFQGNMTQAEALAQESISLARQSHNKLDINHALDMLACVMEYQEDYEQAAVLMQEKLSLARELGDKMAIVVASGSLGNYALYRGDYVRATSLVEETLALATELGFQHNSALAHYTLGEVKRLQGVVVQAEAHFREGLRLAQEVGSRYAIGCNLIGLAKLAAATGRFDRAAYLFGASASWLNPMLDREVEPWLRQDYQRVMEGVCVHLGEQKYKAAWERGQTVTPELVLTQQPLDDSVASLVPKLPPEPLPRYPDGLTSREVEVLRLVALGWSDARVAEHLVISPRTVNGHLRSVYNKINVNSRTAATRYAIEHALIHEQQ